MTCKYTATDGKDQRCSFLLMIDVFISIRPCGVCVCVGLWAMWCVGICYIYYNAITNRMSDKKSTRWPPMR